MATYTDEQIKAYMDHLRKMGKYTEDQIGAYEKHLRSNFGPDQPGSSEDNPATTDIFGSDENRFKSGFADEQHLNKLIKPGFSSPTLNTNGDLVVKGDQSGRYFKDASNFFPTTLGHGSDLIQRAKAAINSMHPLNWLERNAGSSLPLGGMVAGEALGAAASAASGSAMAPALIPAGSFAGAGAGESLRQGIGNMLGVRGGYDPNQAKDEAALAGIGSGVFGAAKQIPYVKTAAQYAQKALSKLPAALSWGMMGGEIPYADVARNIENPHQVVATGKRGAGLRIAETMENELKARAELENSEIGKARQEFLDKMGDTNIDTTPAIERTNKYLESGSHNTSGEGSLTSSELEALNSLKNKSLVTSTPGDPITGLPGVSYPRKKAWELMKTADSLNRDLITSKRSMLPGTDTPMERSQKGLLGNIKGLLHDASTDYADADKRFTEYAGLANTLKPIERESQEQVVNSIWDKNNTARQEAAKALTPNTYEDLLNLRANQSYKDAGALGGSSKSIIARLGLTGLAGNSYAAGHSSPEVAAAMAAFLAGTSPKAHYLAGQALGRNAIPYALREEARKISAPWRLLKDNQ